MRKTVKIGWLVLGLFVASYQQGATGASHERTNPQLNPAAVSRAPDGEFSGHKRATLPSDAAERRDFAPATVRTGKTSTAVSAAGEINHFDREVIDVHRASAAPMRPGRPSGAAAEIAAQRAGEEHQPSMKRPLPSADGRGIVSQPGVKTLLRPRSAVPAREMGPESVQRSRLDTSAGPAGRVNRLDRADIEARRRPPDANPSIRAMPARTQPDRRLQPGATE